MSESKGSLRHLRRSTAPRHWPITRKGFVWAIKPSPGPHPASLSIPISVILRDVLGYAYTLREARRILSERKVYVDWKVVTDYKYPVGVMDVIYLKGVEEYYRVLPHPTKFFMLHSISERESEIKLLRVKRKTTVKGGNIQLTFHDGRTYLLSKDREADLYKTVRTLDTIVFNLKSKSIMQHIPISEGFIAYVINGRNVGFVGRIETIQQTAFKRARALAELRSLDGNDVIRTILDYVFTIGAEKPIISLPTSEEINAWEERLSQREQL
ncbi:MAG: 30S ribosomal protein S4e [Thermofilaceae archaeon]